ncbi:phage tail sheath subtilisin-like domain-containing protein [Streptomyces sp. NPDC092307]|uniref:phage tail sheath subtilisin-like domain-containing protein n=1 Tax=Streptomyces sp. NPDC092307 TaxID=3366013 RepID=UPI003818EB20
MTYPTNTPGVYIREISSGVRLISGVATSTPAFLAHYDAPTTTPGSPRVEYVRTWRDFTLKFTSAARVGPDIEAVIDESAGTATTSGSTSMAVKAEVGARKIALLKFTDVPLPASGSRAKLRVRAAGADAPLTVALGPDTVSSWGPQATWSSIAGGAGNGDSVSGWDPKATGAVEVAPGWIEVDVTALFQAATRRKSILTLALTTDSTSDITIYGSASDYPPVLVIEPAGAALHANSVLHDAVYGYFANSGGPCYIVEAAPSVDAALAALERLPEVKIVVYPDLWTTGLGADGSAAQKIAEHCLAMGNRMALLHTNSPVPPTQGLADGLVTGAAQKFSAVYYPWVKAVGPDGGAATLVPPSGHVAGVWGRVDAARGVHKAPANEVVMGVTDLEYLLTDGEQEDLNPEGVNCLRVFPGQGIRVWGARTLDTDDSDWTYINVRRLINYLEESIRLGTNWAVFEPNDERLWSAIQRNVSSFLMDMYRAGSLFGATAEEAFYVVCNASNNPPEELAKGNVLCEVGVAAVRPAEFIVFEVMQITGNPAQT